MQPHAPYSSWNSPGQNTAVGSFSPSPGDLLNPGTEPRSPTMQVDSLPAKPQGKPNHFTVYVNQVITSYALNLYSDICQLFLNKTGKKAHRLE